MFVHTRNEELKGTANSIMLSTYTHEITRRPERIMMRGGGASSHRRNYQRSPEKRRNMTKKNRKK